MAILLETSLGDIVIDLLTEQCPFASRNMLKMSKIKYYNNCLFQIVQKDFLTKVINPIQPDTSIYEICNTPFDLTINYPNASQYKYYNDQIHPDILKHNKFGLVSTANEGPDKNASSFFITLSNDNLEQLNGKHTVFGLVTEGLDILKKLNDVIVDDRSMPFTNIRIHHTVILDDPFDDFPNLNDFIPDASPVFVKPLTDHRLEFADLDKCLHDERTQQQILEDTQEHETKSKALVLTMLNDLPDEDIKPPDNILFICKLNSVTTERDLELIFGRFGVLRSCEVVRDWKTGQSLQYAFIEFEKEEAAEEAFFKMNNVLIDERRIKVDFSQSVSKQWLKFKSDKRQHELDNNNIEEGDNSQQLQLRKRMFGAQDVSMHDAKKGQYGMVFDDNHQQHHLQHKEGINNQKKHKKTRSHSESPSKQQTQTEINTRIKRQDRERNDSNSNQNNNKRYHTRRRSRSRSRERQNSKSSKDHKNKYYDQRSSHANQHSHHSRHAKR